LTTGALASMDRAFADFAAKNPGDSGRQAQWQHARSKIVDRFLGASTKSGTWKFDDAALPKITPVAIELLLPDGSPYPLKGRLNFAATAIDTRLGTQQLRAEFDNPRQLLLPGQFVTVRITAGERDKVFLVPQAAVVQTEKGNLVFTVDADGKAQARPVKTGDWIGRDWTILSGLNAGDKVVVDNLLKLQPGVAVTEAPPAAAQAAPNAATASGKK